MNTTIAGSPVRHRSHLGVTAVLLAAIALTLVALWAGQRPLPPAPSLGTTSEVVQIAPARPGVPEADCRVPAAVAEAEGAARPTLCSTRSGSVPGNAR